jgi:D-alanine-D-alanine ligase-like ATP-grasp enzyme
MASRETVGPLLGGLFQKLAPQLGATVIIEPRWKFVGQIIFPNGRKRYFRGSTVDLNPVGASDIAKDKDYAAFFMRSMGYPVAPGEIFFSRKFSRTLRSRKNIDAAYRYAVRLGFPVVVKPNSGSQGVGVAKVYTKRDFYKAMRAIFIRDRAALVQPPLQGRDYRIVVLDKRVISAYQRIPLNVVGDGRSTIKQLLRVKQATFVAAGRDTIVRSEDKRIAENLSRHKLTMRSVLRAGERLYLLANANLSSGGDAVDVTRTMHRGFKKLAIQLTADMGLRLCGVDLIVCGDITRSPQTYWVLEVNAAPGLDHYVTTGKAQERIVEAMYLEVLKAML